jgi:hypothetical protein
MRKNLSILIIAAILFTLPAFAQVRIKFIASDHTLVINKVSVDGSEFTSEKILTAYSSHGTITCYVKGGNAGCAQAVVFKFATFDSFRNQWDTAEWLSVSVTPSGTSDIQKTVSIDAYMEKIKLLSVQNQETTTGYTFTVNASIFLK